MASLGSLNFDIGFKLDPKELEDIKKKALDQLKELEVKYNMNVSLSKDDLAKQVNEALAKQHKINVSVDREKLSKDLSEAIPNDVSKLGYIDSLIAKMGELEKQYRSLEATDGVFPQDKANDLARSFAAAQSELNAIGRNLSSVFSKSFSDINLMSEKTIGDIQNKIKFLQQYRITIPIENESAIKSVDNLLTRLKSTIDAISKEPPIDPFKIAENTLDSIKTKISALTELKGKSIIGSDEYNKANTELERLKILQKEVLNPPAPAKTFAEVMGMDARSLNEIKNKISEIRKLRDSINISTPTGMSAAAELNKEEAALLRVQKEHLNNIKINSLAEGSILQLRAQVSNLIIAYDELSRSERKAGAGEELLKKIQRTTIELNEAEQASMRYQRNVGNYKSGWNGLQHQLMQLAREMPAAAYGMNIFFAAISNNLPMFGDELAKARAEYKALVAAQKQGLMLNQKAIPVWKQLVKGIFSGQMAFTVIVTLLTLYGAKLVDWIFKTKSATKAHDEFIKSIKSGNSEYGEAIKEITRLEGILSNVDGKYITAKDAIDEYNDSIGKNIGRTDDLNTAIQTLTDKKDEYLRVMFQMAMANAFLAEMTQKASEAAAIRNKVERGDVKFIDKVVESFKAASNYQTARPTDGASWDEFVRDQWNKQADEAENAGLDLAKSYMDAIKKGYDMAADAGIDLIPGDKDKDKKGKDPMQERLKRLNEAYAKYKELAALVGREKAIPVIQDMILPDFDPDKFKDQIQAIYDNIKNSAEVRGEAGAILFGLGKDQITEDLKETEVYIKKTIASWDLFSELKESAGAEFAAKVVFGGDVAYKDVIDQLRQNIEDELSASGKELSFDDLIKMPESSITNLFGSSMAKFVKAYNEQSKKITDENVKNLAKLLSNQKNYEDKRKEIIAKAEEEAQALRNAGYEKEAQERERRGTQEVASLDFDQFKESDLWAKTFEDLDRLSTATINDVIAKIEEFKSTAGRDLPVKDFKELMNILKKMRGEVESRNPLKTLVQGFKELSKAKKGSDEAADAIDKIKTAFADADPYIQSFTSAFGSLSQMFSDFGDEDMAKNMSNAQDALSSISNIGQGFAKGGIVGGIGAAVGEAAKWIGKLANAHDDILDKAIEKSIQQAERLRNTYEAIERSLKRSLGENSSILGNVYNPYLARIEEEEKRIADLERLLSQFTSKGKPSWMSISQYQSTIKQYNSQLDEARKSLEELNRLSNSFSVESNLFEYQRKLIEQEIEELKKQRDAELQKNTPDPSTLARLDAEILEAEDRLAYFAEDLANTLYGINLKDWASELGDTLYNAWKQGEDGAEAFKKKSAEIIGDVMNDMLKISILEPMMKDVREALFGKDGKSGYFGNDYALDESEMKGLASILMEGEKKSEAYYEALDGLNDYLEKNYGVSLKDKSGSEGLSAGIKGITEDTANLLASYANSMRADGAKRTELLAKYINDNVPEMSAMAKAQLVQLTAIAANTGRNADAADEILDYLSRAWDHSKRGFRIG